MSTLVFLPKLRSAPAGLPPCTPIDVKRVLDIWDEARACHKSYAVECRYRNAVGHYCWFMTRALPVKDHTGRIVQWFGTGTDIDEAKRNEEELRRVNADLEQFAYSASHDLKEPLRAVAIYSQLLQRDYRDKLDARGDEYLRIAIEGAHRMETLVSDLLAYTRVENITDEPILSVDASFVLNRVLSDFDSALSESGSTVEYEALPRLRVKHVHLQQLFQNIISNAIKYRGRAPARIRITAAPEGGLIRLCVQDNGIGIEPDYAQQIFGLFRRLHSADQYPGTGLGLAICQKIVQRYGGRIWVESEGSGRGSRFCFTLPSGD